MDTVSSKRRSEIMSRVRSKNTKPEMTVRSLVHSLGYRYRLHGKDLPGKPDMVFRSRKKVIFIHGCFWHRHRGCQKTSTPKSRVDFWTAKFEGNKARDAKIKRKLTRMGWQYLVIWECQVKDKEKLEKRITNFLED